MMWREITGEDAPACPISARDYAQNGLPWFSLYDETLGALGGSSKLANVKSVKNIDEEKSKQPLQDDGSVEAGPTKKLWAATLSGFGVRDGDW
jgi:hypothetical protein